MIKITILAVLIGTCLAAPTAYEGPDCVKQRMDAITGGLPAGYVVQLKKLIQCSAPKFLIDCYENNMEQKVPTDLESLINATCTRGDYNKIQKFNNCMMTSTTKAFTAGQEIVNQFNCQVNVISSREKGYICEQWKSTGSEKAAEFAKTKDNAISNTQRMLVEATPQDIKSCAEDLPKKSSEILDLICDYKLSSKIGKCLQDKTTVRAVFEIGQKIQPRWG